MNPFLGVFVVLMAVEAAGVGTFLVLHLRSDWRATDVSRHLAYYAAALMSLYLVGFLSLVLHALWFIVIVLLVHVAWAVVIWQRVWLVLRRRK